MINQENNGQNNGYDPQNGQQPNNGYNPQNGQQPNNGYNPQYGQQPNNGYNPQYGQPNGYAVPTAQQVLQASPAEKEAAWTSASSVFMIILCVVSTINLLTGFVGKILSFNIFGLLTLVLDILIVVGIWLTFVNAKKRNLSSTGLSLIRIPYIIQFVFNCIFFTVSLLFSFLTGNILVILLAIVTYVFQIICFNSVNKTLKLAVDINQNRTTAGKKSGSFAAIVMIIYASIELLRYIVNYVSVQSLLSKLDNTGLPATIVDLVKSVVSLVTGTSTMSLVVNIIIFVVGISGAIVMLQFGNKLKQINGQ